MGHLIKISSDVTESMDKGNNAERLKELYQGESTCPSFRQQSLCGDVVHVRP